MMKELPKARTDRTKKEELLAIKNFTNYTINHPDFFELSREEQQKIAKLFLQGEASVLENKSTT